MSSGTSGPTTRRTVLAAAVAVAAAAAAAASPPASAAGARRPAGGAPETAGGPSATATGAEPRSTVEYRGWSSGSEWGQGAAEGTAVRPGPHPGLVIGAPRDTTAYTDPHTGTTADWEYAVWTSPEHRPAVPAGELIASWNAGTPPGTWLRVELRATYTDGTTTPWYTLGIWAAGDADIRRTSVGGQDDGRSTVWTDTVAVKDTAGALRLASYRLRLTLYRAPGGGATPTVWRIGAMTSDVPDRFEVPAAAPGPATGVELPVPRYSQNVHTGRYPEYDNGGEAWCSPTATQMIVEYWGRKPTAEDLAWVRPEYDDPQVCHAARRTYDHRYRGCGNWPFSAAYAATYDGLRAVVTRLDSLADAERLIAAGIPLITSQSFLRTELDGAGYGTAGHLMTLIGFTAGGDIIAGDPAAPDNASVRRIYPRRQWENIWLRTKRYDDRGRVRSGTGGICYLVWPAEPAPSQHRVLRQLGIR